MNSYLYLSLSLFSVWCWWLPNEKIIWILQSGHCLLSLIHNNRLLNVTLLCEALNTVEKSLFCSVWFLKVVFLFRYIYRAHDGLIYTLSANLHSGDNRWCFYAPWHMESYKICLLLLIISVIKQECPELFL